MTIDEVKSAVSNRLSFLNTQRSQAELQGDLTNMVRLDAEIAETQETLTRLG